ncbi:glycoside hydrolase family 5 protein [Ciceribacter azotifigens]|uniref:glycoside hydrolase family 5 protein n=1 Tax=Ciceribacter azotifigens TaxID=2069303 RepID=UPI003A8B01AA
MFVASRFGNSSLFGFAAVATTAVFLAAWPGQATEGCFRGINLSGAEFGEPPGTAGKDYVYPSNETIDYFASKGFTSVRLPFLWERLQPRLEAELDAAELARLVETVERLRDRGMRIVLDPHNYARYRGEPIGSAAVPVAAFADFWGRLARVFASQPDVSFGLMNEPHDISAGQWLEGVNAAIAKVREAGAGNLVLVPGTAWTGAHSWRTSPSDRANGEVMLGVVDPSNNYAYEVHQYFDLNFSGTSSSCDRGADAVAAVEAFTRWLRDHDKRGYLGEFGVPAEKACVGALADMVRVVEGNRDLWVGWAYWVAGDWWPPSEALNIQPTMEGDRPQLAGLAPALKDFSSSAAECPALDRP